MENTKNILIITRDMLREANIDADAGLTVTCENGAILITEPAALDFVPDELILLFEELGIGGDTVRSVLTENRDILNALAARST
jgi:hypothetical protein